MDEATTQVVTRASIGLLPQTRRREFWVPLLVGVANAVVLAFAGADTATVRGAIPGFVAAGIALIVMITEARRKKLVWHR